MAVVLPCLVLQDVHGEPDTTPAGAVSRTLSPYSSFDPHDYVREYYSRLGPENRFLLDFYHDVYRTVSPTSRLLEFGGGPTVYQLLSASLHVGEIVFAEYLEQNRNEVRRWLRGDSGAWNWDLFLHYVSARESHDLAHRDEMKDQVRQKVTSIIECDAFMPNMLGSIAPGSFDIVSSGFCLECISPHQETFQRALEGLLSYLGPRGSLVMTLLKNSSSYQVGEKLFPSFALDEKYIQTTLQNLGLKVVELRSCKAEHDQGYEGLIAVKADRL